MSISLFEHNQAAYSSVVAMLSETGKAAVIHPTGTGKSFIGFKLCEDNPESRVCWIAPSNYIFKTQIENLLKTGAEAPENIQFYTYAKLSIMSKDEMREIAPDYIILDEFHRAGAEVWGRTVENLLKLYEDVPLLGLSATNIRYLDNRRNMADELLDGNIASEITLSEAIVRGILMPPKYVLAVFKYREQLDIYEARIAKAKSRAVRDKAEAYLEELRRTLEMSEGLDEVFSKHIDDRNGKYLVFCANVQHMNEMLAVAPEWFVKVDKQPHIYSAYSDDPETSRAFSDFKSDNSNHLKLLFCIDMLNEGIHVDGVDGVILLRPTVSPIIYKQQIGRALSASADKRAVIFDIVLNIQNLYSIDSIKEEMEDVVSYYREYGMSDCVVNDHFEVIDEVKDCLELFNKLTDSLSASWDLMYECAKIYYEKFGNLEIPKHFITEEGYNLGTWIQTQRRVKAGMVAGQLDDERIAKLNAIGMSWGSYEERSWLKNYKAAQKYYKSAGNLLVPSNYISDNGIFLGGWIQRLRSLYKQNRISQEKENALEEIGMVWDLSDLKWKVYYEAAYNYYCLHGNLNIPYKYETNDGIKLWQWLQYVRVHKESYSDEQINALTALNIRWNYDRDVKWNINYQEAKKYFDQNNNLNIPVSYVAESGIKLGIWISRQRSSPKLSDEQKKLLSDIGMVWKTDAWDQKYQLAKEYFDANGSLDMTYNYISDGIWVGKWVNEQRLIYNGKRVGKQLSAEQIKLLETIGMQWKERYDLVWEERYEEVKEYFAEHGNVKIPRNFIGRNGTLLNAWINNQKKDLKRNKLNDEQIKLLKDVGICLNHEKA